jgi:hypothetical protein
MNPVRVAQLLRELADEFDPPAVAQRDTKPAKLRRPPRKPITAADLERAEERLRAAGVDLDAREGT